MADFKLSASLKGHEDDVRAVTFTTSHDLVSASRDATVRTWRLKSSNPPSYDDTIISHGTSFVNAVAFLPPSSEYPDGLILSGGKDTWIEARQPGSPAQGDPERMLLGHQGNVCALDVFADGKTQYVVSGSWDSSAMIWDVAKGESTATLEGHNGSVWAVLAYDKDHVITGCADHSIRVFSRAGKLLNTITGSTDVVRSLCKLPKNAPSGAQFASTGNDSVIRLWTIRGEQVGQLHGHENFVYSLAVLPSGELVSSSEDRSVRIWKGSECVQTITHPAISVWTVAANAETSDIVTGASDRIVRVFSRSKDRHADEATLQAFDDSVKGSSIPQQQMPDINKEKLPGPEFLQQKSGTKEGQVQMIREANGNISAHQWSNLAQQWLNVGTVVDAAGSSGRKQEFMGQDYDYVFDVDIEEGKPPLKLPYNLSQNPYEVARKFIGDNELPLTYLDQVANFIISNTQGATLGQQSSTSSEPVTSTRPKILPQKEYLSISTASFSVIGRKLQEINGQLISDGHKDKSLSPGDLQSIPDFIKQLEAAIAKPTTSPALQSGSDICVRVVTQWPLQNRIPGLDLLRCLAAAYPEFSTRHDIINVLRKSGAFPTASSDSPSNPNLTMLAIRALANLFVTTPGRSYATSNMESMRELVSPQFQPTAGAVNRNLHIAAATLYINLAVLLTSIGGSEAAAFAQKLLSDLASLLNDKKVVDSETVYRALVAVGTLVKIPGAGGSNASEVEAAVKAAGGRAKEPRVKAVLEEMMG